MKKVVFTIASVVLCAVYVQAQNVVKPAAPTTSTVVVTSYAEMKFETDIHDFGTIQQGGNGTWEFKFKNTGAEPLIITEAKGSCGCTVPTYPQNIPIKPGESQIIRVTYDTKRVGNFTKTVNVYANTKQHVTVLTIKGTVVGEPVEEVFPTNGKSENGAIPFEKH